MSTFFTRIGLGNADIGVIILILAILLLISIILNILNLCTIRKVTKKYEKFMKGKNANSLESEIVALFEDNKFLKNSIDKNKKDIQTLYKKLESTIQKVGIVKYDAFQQMGGKLSFCLCMLDEENSGFMLNSVHSTEGCYTYTKEIIRGKAMTDLGKEEEIALNMAIGENE